MSAFIQVFFYVTMCLTVPLFVAIRVLGFGYFGTVEWVFLFPAILWVVLAFTPFRIYRRWWVGTLMFLALVGSQIGGAALDIWGANVLEAGLFFGLAMLKAFAVKQGQSAFPKA